MSPRERGVQRSGRKDLCLC